MPNQNTVSYFMRRGLDLSDGNVNFTVSDAENPTPGGWPKVGGVNFFPAFFNGGEVAVPLTELKTWDSIAANLPATAASDDLGLIAGTFKTSNPVVRTSDAKATTVTQKARFQVPINFDVTAIQTLKVRVEAGMTTTNTDGTATVDVECVRLAAPTVDLCTTAATSIAGTAGTYTDKDFTLTTTNLTAGDILDIVVTIAITDSATGTAVLGQINSISLVIT